MTRRETGLYEMSTGALVTSLVPFSSPADEYRAAFEAEGELFLTYYRLEDGKVERLSFTRGQFWDLSCSAAKRLASLGLSRGDRVVHCFFENSYYDLVFRLAAVLVGCVPVTVNWQADDDDRIVYKALATGSKLLVYNEGFAGRVDKLRSQLPGTAFSQVEEIGQPRQAAGGWSPPHLSYDDEKMVIFTSGTTDRPKGVSLPHRSYLANRLTFEHYFAMTAATRLDLLLANPLHHSNSSALSDWGMRRPGARIHLLQRYSTAYWEVLVEVARRKRDLLVTPMVSRHIDFLESLAGQFKLPVELGELKEALSQTEVLIGSAPVGPTTVKRIVEFSGHLPAVRFGSTETCLQVMATPRNVPQAQLLRAFESGWSHTYRDERMPGYYIGREHYPFTRVRLVRAIDPGDKRYFQPCELGEPGYFITQGPNTMDRYLGDSAATAAVFMDGWYIGLRDIGFALKSQADGQLDYYWMSRDSALLIRGGANYSCDQVGAELAAVLAGEFHLKPEQFKLAVVGLRAGSEHEDSCCVTIELAAEAADLRPRLEADFMQVAQKRASKGARPDYVRFATIPLNFKGAVVIPELKRSFKDFLRQKGITVYD